MKRTIVISFMLLILSGCGAYKELTPKPDLLPYEQGYIELKNDKDYFKLDKDRKYYIRFPRPVRDNFYLVLKTGIKPILGSVLGSSFDNGVPYNARIADAEPGNDSLYVYPVDARVQEYYWVIDTVRFDADLIMNYRYVPRWRFTFENRFYALRRLLAANRIDPTTYNAIGPGYVFQGIDFRKEVANIESRTDNLKKAQGEMESLAQLFPPDIASSRDTAYENYLMLQTDLRNEVTLQQNYSLVLRIVDREASTRDNPQAFMESAPLFLEFFAHKDQQRPPVVQRVTSLLSDRLPGAEQYYVRLLRAKADYTPFSPKPPLDALVKLYDACGTQPTGTFQSLVTFATRFNVEATALQSARAKLGEIERTSQRGAAWGSEGLYTDMIARAGDAKSALPVSQLDRYEGGAGYACTRALTAELSRTSAEATALQSLYQRGLAGLTQMKMGSWRTAENQLRELTTTSEYDNVREATAQRAIMAEGLDAELFSRVKQETQKRTEAFITRNTSSIGDVPALYRDSAFTPVYDLTFSTGGATQLQQHKKEIDAFLSQARHVRFPEGAIRLLYGEFVRNPADQGVLRARAIVAHGKEYTGGNKELTSMVNECDENVAKWIIRPKEYRKIYALPMTSNPQGKNDYMFRLRLQIPTEAQFPVYDVNIKLPKDLAEKARTAAWYSSITIDKKPIKNEGRFRITTPTADNNYESLVTPVEMDKEGQHILEVRFPYPGLRVFEISAMAQVPIIRKN